MNSTGCKYYLNKITRMLIPGVLFMAVVSCKNDPEQIKALTGRNNRQEDHAEDVTLIYSKDGKVKMRAFAHDFVHNEQANPPYIDMNTHQMCIHIYIRRIGLLIVHKVMCKRAHLHLAVLAVDECHILCMVLLTVVPSGKCFYLLGIILTGYYSHKQNTRNKHPGNFIQIIFASCTIHTFLE